MCGISGIINQQLTPDKRAKLVNKMISCMHHRGPDSNGWWSDELISLGHNRLSIIDLSDNGSQPMHRGDWVITYNGELYNYLEIRNELKDRYNARFITQSDTEVILAAWETWGEAALNKFRGMWAFAIYNQKSHELYLCRDRFGIKPLYYYDLNGHFIFASEIKAILEDVNVARRAKLTTVVDFLMGFNDHSAETFFENIYQLEPGCYMHYNLVNGSKSLRRYYDLAQATAGKTSTIEEFAACLEESVLLHLRSDVPVGTCLSGGLDSSSVATLAGRYMLDCQGKNFHAVTAQSEDPANDESEYARAVVENSSLIWHLTKPSADDFLENWEKCQWCQEEPVGGPSVFMQYCVMQTAREAGLKVMLDGQGGDETLLGYERYYPPYFMDCIRRGQAIKASQAFMESVHNSKVSLAAMTMYCGYFLLPWLRVWKNKKKWMAIPDEVLQHGLNTLQSCCQSFSSIRKLQISEITRFCLPVLLKYEDRNSMAWSVEARVPFVDYRLIETAIALQPDDKINSGFTKWALRKTMDGKMPDSITWRKNKIGFAAPAEKWAGTLKEEMNRKISSSIILRELNLKQSHAPNGQYLLYSLALWEELYGMNLS
jgi:asparagine synthase (glutamine-hydrolysing)